MPTDSVNLKAFCTAFKAMGLNPQTSVPYAEEICKTLDPNWQEAGDDVFLFVDKPGDGKIFVQIGGRLPAIGTLSIRRVFCSEGADEAQEMVSYFVAGALGPKHVPSKTSLLRPENQCTHGAQIFFREQLNPGIVSGLMQLREICQKTGTDDCLTTDAAGTVRDLWRGIRATRRIVSDKRTEMVRRIEDFFQLANRVEDKSKLAAETADDMRQISQTIGHLDSLDPLEIFQRNIASLNSMIAAAEKHIGEESRQRSSEKSQGVQVARTASGKVPWNPPDDMAKHYFSILFSIFKLFSAVAM